MKITTFLLVLALSSICYSQQTNETVTIGAENRSYVQYLPTGFNPATESLPVIFCLHGIGDVATNMTNIGFNQIGDTARFITIYPQGLVNAFGQTSWANGTILASTANDIGFFNAMMNDMILNQNADPSRVYVCGFSMGSIMSYKLACDMNNRVAAIGAMSGTMSTADLTNCVPTYLTPVIHFHGTADGTVPYNAGALPSLSLVPATLDFWKNAHGCAATSDSTQIANTAADGLTVDRFVYQTCSPLESVEFWRINGGDHNYFYQPMNDFTESIEIWRFFSKWTHSNPADASIESLSNIGVGISPNPSNGKFEVTTTFDDMLEVYSSTGELLHSQKVHSGNTKIDLSKLSGGIYFLKLKSTSGLTERIVIQ